MTVEEARDRRVCRICGRQIGFVGGPKDWPLLFGKMAYPVRLTLDFGKEFAHTDCLTMLNKLSKPGVIEDLHHRLESDDIVE